MTDKLTHLVPSGKDTFESYESCGGVGACAYPKSPHFLSEKSAKEFGEIYNIQKIELKLLENTIVD